MIDSMILRIVLLVVIALAALGLGYFLRRLAVRRLKTTVLDDWIIQTVGIAILVPFVLITIFVVAFFVTSNIGFLIYLWGRITSGLQGKDVTGIVLGLLGNIIESLLIIGLGVGIGRTLMKLISGRLTEQHMDINIRTLLGRILYGIIILMIFFWILSLWQISIAVPVTV